MTWRIDRTGSRTSNVRKALAVCALAGVLGSCAAAPRVRPVKAGDVDTGPGSLEATRRQLQGSWDLVSYDVYEKGTHRRLNAEGILTYDEFGNLTLNGALKEPTAAAANSRPTMLNYKGRVVIDVVAHEMRLLDIDTGGTPIPNTIETAVNPDNVRKFELQNGSLTMTIVGADGMPSGVSVWKKRTS